MRRIKGKLAEILILEPGEQCPEDGICFLEKEYEWAQKLAVGYKHDPESHESFWQTLFENKKNPAFNLFEAFPKPYAEKPSGQKEISLKYCGEIIEMLKGHRPRVPEGN